MTRTSKNIHLLFIIKFAKWFMLYMPISYLFYLENGFGKQEYLLLHGIYSGIIALLEVPSGYIADVFGRKKAIILGTFFGTIGFSAYSVSYGFLGFLIAEILLGIGQSLLSGADTALLYDSLKEAKREKDYIKIEGRITATGNIAEALAGIFVSIIILNLYRSYFQLQTLFIFIAFICAMFLKEPVIHSQKRSASFRDILEIVNVAFRKNHKLRNFIYFSSIVGFASLSMAWTAQLIFKEIELNQKYFGYAWVILNSFVAFGSMMARHINKLLKMKWSFIYMTIFLPIGFGVVAINLSYITLVPLAILFLVRGTAHPILKNYINQNTNSSERATVLSLRSLLIRTIFFILAPLLGVVSDSISLQFALLLCSISILIPSVILTLLIFLNSKIKAKNQLAH